MQLYLSGRMLLNVEQPAAEWFLNALVNRLKIPQNLTTLLLYLWTELLSTDIE